MMHDVRCCKCSKLLARVSGTGNVEVKCPRCRFINKMERHERQIQEDSHVQTSGALAGRKAKAGQTHTAAAG